MGKGVQVLNIKYILLTLLFIATVYFLKNSQLLYGFAYYIIPIFISFSTLLIFRGYLKERYISILGEKYETIFIVLAGILPSYIMGFITGFGLNILAITPTQFIINVLYFLGYYAMLELLRYNIVEYIKNLSLSHVILISLFIVILEVPFSKLLMFYPPFILKFISLISISIVYTIIASRYSFNQLLIVRLLTIFMTKLFPILPDMQWYIDIQITLLTSIIQLSILYLIFRYPFMNKRSFRSINIGKIVSKRVRLISNLGTALVIVLVLLFSISLFLGYRFLVISSSSMTPTLKVGDLVITEQTDDVGEGDVIAFMLKDKIVVHRIVKIDTSLSRAIYYTKGDALDTMDPWELSKENILGKVVFIVPYMGMPMIYMMGFFGDYITSVIATITFILALNMLYIAKELVQHI